MNKIPQAEIRPASMYFAMSNMAVLDLAPKGYPLATAYQIVDGMVQSDTGESMEEERQDWENSIKKEKEGGYCFTEWNKVKSKWGF